MSFSRLLRIARLRIVLRASCLIGMMLVGDGLSTTRSTRAASWPTTAPREKLDLTQVIARVRDAMRYDGLKQYKHGIIVEGTAHEWGVDGKYILMFTPDGKFLEKVESKLSRTVGFDGETGWIVDYTGMPRTLELAELEHYKLDIAITTGRWLDRDNEFVLSVVDENTNSKQVTLSIKFESGVWELWILIDRSTWLPINVLLPPHEVTDIILLDYRPVLGFKFPHNIQKAAGADPKRYDIRTIREAPSSKEEDPYAPITKKPADTQFYKFASPNLEFRLGKSMFIVVRPRINGRDAGWFVLDSGTSGMAVDPRVADRLDLPSFGAAMVSDAHGTKRDGAFRQADRFELGPMTISNPIFVEMDTSFVFEKTGDKLAGFCGYDVFSRAVVEIEMKNANIRLRDPEKYTLTEGRWQALHLAGNLPCVSAKFEGGREALFVVDTGMVGFVSFNAHAVERFDLLKDRETKAMEQTAISSSKNIREGRIDWFELAGHRFDDAPPVGFDEVKDWFFSELSTAGRIGLRGLILDFKVIFDYPHKRIAFVKLDDKQPTSSPTTGSSSRSGQPARLLSRAADDPASGVSGLRTRPTRLFLYAP